MRVLLLGGTAESRAIRAGCPDGVALVESWAGRTRGAPTPEASTPEASTPEAPSTDPSPDPGTTDAPAPPDRVGGFGGSEGLASYLREHRIDAVIDATHPFAARMTRHAVAACDRAGVPLLRVARPGWSDHPDAQRWRWVADHVAASAAVAGRALLTVGRQPLPHYRSLPDAVARVVDPPEDTSPLRTIPGWEIIAARGPFTLADERALLSSRAIGTLVTKDSGGPAPKLDAARELGVRVVVVRRPEPPSGLATVPSAEAALAWLAARAS